MSLASLQIIPEAAASDLAAGNSHVLVVMPAADALPPGLPGRDTLVAVLARRRMKPKALAKTPLAADVPGGGRISWAMVDAGQPCFSQLTALRKAVQPLLDEHPSQIAIAVRAATAEEALPLAQQALYVVLVNGTVLPAKKRKPAKPVKRVVLLSDRAPGEFAAVLALARANIFARELTTLPPNELTPGHYRKRVRDLARAQGWKIEEYGFRRLKKMGAGAFCAVAQGSSDEDAAIVRLSYRPSNASRRVALVGKGICFDTGGHNLKPAKYMAGMHEDMNGSAVALSLLMAAHELRLPVAVDAWLAIAQNHLSPKAYKQDDIVTALDGTNIEIVHTDAEGRMVLADTLTLASRSKPDLMIDFATLTGSMISALGNRYSGVFASRAELAELAIGAGAQSGERVCLFPMDEDYDAGLDSKVADVKQCSIEGDADHILAARFLQRFTGNRPWLHVDLAAANCRGGLGAVAGDVTGFGVAWGAALLTQWLAKSAA